MGIEGYYEDYFDERQEKEKLTNFQKIKNMSLDEMAEWLAYYFTQYGYEETKQWLQEESE